MKNKMLLGRVCGLSVLVMTANASFAATTQEAVDSLAQRCVVIQSPQSGAFIERSKGLLGVVQRYGFDGNNLSSAERFYLKPAALGEFLLMDRVESFLSSHAPSTTIANNSPDKGSEWRITAVAVNGGFQYRLVNSNTGKSLDRIYRNGLIIKSESQFNLQQRPASECKAFPEVELNVVTSSLNPHDTMRTSRSNIRGYVDGHTHMSAEEFGGGITISGHTFHRWGVKHALKDCKDIHGEGGKHDLIGLAVGDYKSHNTTGWPSFSEWPSTKMAVTHTGYYYKWVERAHLSGLRLMVVYTVDNEVMCTINNAAAVALGKPLPKSCDTLNSVQRQVNDLFALQDYVDAQSGGLNKGFFRIVRTPAEARTVIADGKLAVVIGIEASETFNCSGRNFCDANKLKSRLDTYHAMGVRSIFPVHKFDTQVGGATLDTPSVDIMNMGNFIDNGQYFGVTACDPSIQGNKLLSGPFDLDPAKLLKSYDELSPVLKTAVNVAVTGAEAVINTVGPRYDPAVANGNACNSKGLTSLGVQLINGMIDRKMLIDVDHQSTLMTKAVLDIAEARGYSGLVASHGDTDGNKMDSTEPNFNLVRLTKLGGHISALTRTTESFKGLVTPGYKAMTRAANEKGYLAGIGIGSDYNGLIKMASPRPFTYPFTNEFGVRFDKQVSGNRTFDFSVDGMAHYGLLPELMESYRVSLTNSGDAAIYESMMNSAESYLQMWERASR